MAAGKSNPEVAEELFISLNTVERHLTNIFGKIGATNRVEVANYATRLVPANLPPVSNCWE